MPAHNPRRVAAAASSANTVTFQMSGPGSRIDSHTKPSDPASTASTIRYTPQSSARASAARTLITLGLDGACRCACAAGGELADGVHVLAVLGQGNRRPDQPERDPPPAKAQVVGECIAVG